MWSNKIQFFSQVCSDSVTWGQTKWLTESAKNHALMWWSLTKYLPGAKHDTKPFTYLFQWIIYEYM